VKVAIIKYNAGNIKSVAYAMERFGVEFEETSDADRIASAEKVIFPGVGEASTTMSFLRNVGLDQLIPQLKQPVLGICLGMQLLCRHSQESNTQCLGIFDVDVMKFEARPGFKVPHTGWNSLSNANDWLGTELNGKFVYYVHSYFVPLNACTTLQTEYIQPFSAALRRKNFYAVQFHPEKSGEAGKEVLQQFLKL
jgi:imidazole glycerol-phosphate synthase subunit HisH